MKFVILLCAVVLATNLVAAKVQYKNPDSIDYDFYEKFEKQHGIDVECKGNRTFAQFADCEPRCDFKPSDDCAGAVFVGCSCQKGYLSVDKSRNQCVKPEDCP
ncbi:uncharacterized protein CDAR_275891 [Caerostris darwini]|uniref:TIL domain-containing protein n=1 Tax=Caerostris darwini TaxID=1538125 RepID=A0AAV4RPD8_9ARAC|nr:uncharacterized protein CDAR_275891 [Caerostris darwini]